MLMGVASVLPVPLVLPDSEVVVCSRNPIRNATNGAHTRLNPMDLSFFTAEFAPALPCLAIVERCTCPSQAAHFLESSGGAWKVHRLVWSNPRVDCHLHSMGFSARDLVMLGGAALPLPVGRGVNRQGCIRILRAKGAAPSPRPTSRAPPSNASSPRRSYACTA